MRWLPAFFCALLLVLFDDTILLKSLHITPGSLVLYFVSSDSMALYKRCKLINSNINIRVGEFRMYGIVRIYPKNSTVWSVGGIYMYVEEGFRFVTFVCFKYYRLTVFARTLVRPRKQLP